MSKIDEKDIMELSNEIINAITRLVLAEKPGVLSSRVFKNLASHSHFNKMKTMYANHIIAFDGDYTCSEELKSLTDLRYILVDLFNQENEH